MTRAVASRRGEPGDGAPWWRNAVLYETFVRSFADFDGDGVGDLEGVRGRLGYLELLGIDALRLSPFYLSPVADDGYDVAGHRAVDPVLGNLDTFDALVAEAHGCGLRILLDVVPGYTSDKHPWFASALAAGPGGSERERYHFADGAGGGELPPNDWTAVDGGPAWSRTVDGQWYLHLHGPRKPDLNWGNPEVRADFEHTLRFWLDRGADGVRVVGAHALAKPDSLPEAPAGPQPDPRFDHDGGHEIHQLIRKILDQYPRAVALGEVKVSGEERFARYVRPGELHLAVDNRLARTPFDADALQATIERTIATVEPVGAPPAWALAGHDLTRHATRYGGGERGRRRARAMALVVLGLPGVACLYNGEELGLDDTGLPEHGSQVPIPWEGVQPPFGFSSNPNTWLPIPEEWAPLTVEAQLEDQHSMLSLYRHALELRREHPAFDGDEVEWYGAPPGCCAYRRSPGGLVCALNTSAAPVPIPRGEVLLSSAPLVEGKLAPDATVWLVPRGS